MISKLCLDYGVRVQYSVFEFDLSFDLTEHFLQELAEVIDSADDKVMVVPICEICRKHIHLLGKAEAFALPEIFLF